MDGHGQHKEFVQMRVLANSFVLIQLFIIKVSYFLCVHVYNI